MNNENRSSLRRTITLVVVALLLFSFAGWRIYGQQNGKVSPSPSSHKLASKDTAAVVTSTGTYLDFKAIGVKLQLNSSISDAVYAPFNVAPTDGSQAFGISSQSLINNDATTTACSAASGALGLVIATTNPTVVAGPNSTSQLTPDNKTVFKFGNTYYRYVPPQNFGCGVSQTSVSQAESSQSAFAASFASLQPDSSSASN